MSRTFADLPAEMQQEILDFGIVPRDGEGISEFICKGESFRLEREGGMIKLSMVVWKGQPQRDRAVADLFPQLASQRLRIPVDVLEALASPRIRATLADPRERAEFLTLVNRAAQIHHERRGGR